MSAVFRRVCDFLDIPAAWLGAVVLILGTQACSSSGPGPDGGALGSDALSVSDGAPSPAARDGGGASVADGVSSHPSDGLAGRDGARARHRDTLGDAGDGGRRRGSADAHAPADAPSETQGAPDAGPAPAEIALFDHVWISSQQSDEHFQEAIATFDLPPGPFAAATLVVDLESPCFPFDKWKDDPPPPGQNWPPSCDAFDRNFEWTLDPPAGEGDPPGIELVRAITPFGGPMHFEEDWTDVANGVEPGEHRIRVHISTWSDAQGKVSGSAGGWFVSARLRFVSGSPPHHVVTVVPLFDGSQTADGAPPVVSFEVPEGVTGARIEYRATGHGGGKPGFQCIGPAEEFCRRWHTVRIDGDDTATKLLWRDDCAELCTLEHQPTASGGFDYCKENPTGAIESVKAPRANWCPGSVTPPWNVEAPPLTEPGPHTFSFVIPGLLAGGTWRVSALYVAWTDP